MKLEIQYDSMSKGQYKQFIESLADFIEFCFQKQKEEGYEQGVQKEKGKEIKS